MRLAEKRDSIANEAESDGKTRVESDDKSKAPPAASLTSAVFQRRQETSRGVQVESLGLQANSDAPDEAVDARAQQAILEHAFAEPEFIEPEFVEPELAEPEMLEPEFVEPELVEPEITEPEFVEPELVEPELVGPELVEPELAEPEFVAPEITEPDFGEPEIAQSGFTAAEPFAAAPPIERAELQSARDSAARWRLHRSPSAGFWDRFVKDVSIFTIFFAVLVFVILQTM